MEQTAAGIDIERFEPWLTARVPGVALPLTYELIAGGRSNLTYKLTDAAGETYVLRRPPLGQVLATAHDMGREHRILSALEPTPVPVPRTLARCDDTDVIGAPFYVMDHVEGHVLWSAEVVDQVLPVERRADAARSLIDVLAEIHAVDPDAVGLGELGRKDGYIERQLKRWYRQFNDSKSRDVPLIDQVHDTLRAAVPEQGPATLVHGDYKLENCILDDDGQVVAVLDWELCTLGDPLADLGLLGVFWPEPGHAIPGRALSPVLAGGFPTHAELLERYAAVSGRDLTGIEYYLAFGFWKLACIGEGVYARYKGGSMGADGADVDALGESVFRMAEAAAEAAARMPRA
jgi:aminoglycoside phosphotransferase (APT) family kinase protein